MKFKTELFVTLMILGLGACSSISFKNDHASTQPVVPERSEWYHLGILRLVDFSGPVDLKNRCAGRDWTVVKVERTFLNGLAAGAASSIAAAAFSNTVVVAGVVTTYSTFGVVAGSLWDPWTVSYSCKL